MGTFAAPLGGEREGYRIPHAMHARNFPIFDAAALEVLKAWRYFNAIPGNLPAIVAALLVVAWAVLRGRP
jgi:hypothetical protein